MQLPKQLRPVQPGDRVLTHTGRLAWVLAAIVINNRREFLIEFIASGNHRLWEPSNVYLVVQAVEIAIGNGGASCK